MSGGHGRIPPVAVPATHACADPPPLAPSAGAVDRRHLRDGNYPVVRLASGGALPGAPASWSAPGRRAALLLAIFSVRGLRWLIVLGIEPDRRRLWRSLCANGAASGLASLTPFQLGEVIKIRLIPDHDASAWRLGVSAFFVERVLDLGGVLGMGLCGIAWHFGFAWLAPLALLLPLPAGLLLSVLAIYLHRLPSRCSRMRKCCDTPNVSFAPAC